MGYTSEKTTINKSLESLNQETQRLQKQTNFEYDRLNQRRIDNQAANLKWLNNNQQKLDMGMQQFQQVSDAYEPDTGYTEEMEAQLSEMRDMYYNRNYIYSFCTFLLSFYPMIRHRDDSKIQEIIVESFFTAIFNLKTCIDYSYI